jgi:hypothetical protein
MPGTSRSLLVVTNHLRKRYWQDFEVVLRFVRSKDFANDQRLPTNDRYLAPVFPTFFFNRSPA